jgi:hypothetical protein
MVCHELFGLFWIKLIWIVTEYQMFEPIKYHRKYLLNNWSNSASFIMNFSKLNIKFIIFIINFCQFFTYWAKFERYITLLSNVRIGWKMFSVKNAPDYLQSFSLPSKYSWVQFGLISCHFLPARWQHGSRIGFTTVSQFFSKLHWAFPFS